MTVYDYDDYADLDYPINDGPRYPDYSDWGY